MKAPSGDQAGAQSVLPGLRERLVWPPPSASLHVLHEPPSTPPAERGEKPDVFLIVLDTVRADHLELFGYERATMPRLSEAVRRDFQVASVGMATSSSSLPAHGSMFTGLYAYRHGGHKPFLTDPSNTDTTFTRNRLRHELLPRLRETMNPRLDDALRRLAGQATETSALLRRLAARELRLAAVEIGPEVIRLRSRRLATCPRPVLREAVALAWRRAGGRRGVRGVLGNHAARVR